MTYEYITDETSYRLDKIKYAGNGNIEPEYTVQFNYDDRDDVEYRFIHNRIIEEKYLLKIFHCPLHQNERNEQKSVLASKLIFLMNLPQKS